MRGTRSLANAAALLGLIFCAACGASIFPPVEFPDPPDRWVNDPSGAVVWDSATTVALRAPDPEQGPQAPYATVQKRLRILVTADLAPTLRRVTLATGPHLTVDTMIARIAKPSGETIDIAATATQHGMELFLPGAPGDLIDILWQQTYLVIETLPRWVLANSAPTVQSKVEIVADEGLELEVISGEGSKRTDHSIERDTDDGRSVFRLAARDLAAAPTTSGLADPQRFSPWLLAVLQSTLLDGQTKVYADSWQTVGNRVRSTLKPSMAIDDEIRQELSVGLAKARMRKLVRLLQPSAHNPAPLTRAPLPFAQLKEGGANAIEAAAVAAAVTRGSMEEGHIALVVPRHGPLLIDALPGLYAFTAAAAAFQTSEGWRLADPSCVTCDFGSLPVNLAGGRALILTDKPSIVDIPASAVQPNRQEMLFDWTLAVDGKLSGSLVTKLEGQTATLARAILESGKKNQDERNELRNLLLGLSSGISINAIVQQDSRQQPGEPYQIKVAVTAIAKKSSDGAFTMTPTTIAGASVSWDRTVSPGVDNTLPAPAQVDVTSLVRLPPFVSAELPTDLTVKRSFATFHMGMVEDHQLITLTRKLSLTSRDVPAAQTDVLVSMANELDAADAQTITITPED